MFEKNMRFAYLVDFYGEVLDENTRAIMTAYYDDDLSLAEIASSVGISRQGVRHTLKRGEEQLSFLEVKLGLAERYTEISELAKRISEVRSALTEKFGEDASKFNEELLYIEEKILNKGV